MRYKALKSRDLDLDLLRSLKARSNCTVGLSMYEFLLMINSNHMSISHRLGDIWPNFCSKFCIFLKIEAVHLGVQGKPPSPPPSPVENEVDWLNTFGLCC